MKQQTIQNKTKTMNLDFQQKIKRNTFQKQTTTFNLKHQPKTRTQNIPQRNKSTHNCTPRNLPETTT